MNKRALPIAILLCLLFIGGYQYLSNQNNYTSINNESCSFRNEELLEEHYEKHGIDMGYKSEEEYLNGACDVVYNKESLHKNESDGDDIYYLKDSNEFVVVSTDGYVRTYFLPDDGIDYFNRK